MAVPVLLKLNENPVLPEDRAEALEVVQKQLQTQGEMINALIDWAGRVRLSADDDKPDWLMESLLTPDPTATTYETQAATTTNLLVETVANEERLRMNPGLVSANDTTVKWLENSLAAGTNITLATVNEGANEQIQITAATPATGASIYLLTTEVLSSTVTGNGDWTINVKTEFGLDQTTIDAVLVRADASMTQSTPGGITYSFKVQRPGATYPDLLLAQESTVLVGENTTIPPPAHTHPTADKEQIASSDWGIVRCSSNQIHVVTSGGGTFNLICFGYLTGTTAE